MKNPLQHVRLPPPPQGAWMKSAKDYDRRANISAIEDSMCMNCASDTPCWECIVNDIINSKEEP